MSHGQSNFLLMLHAVPIYIRLACLRQGQTLVRIDKFYRRRMSKGDFHRM